MTTKAELARLRRLRVDTMPVDKLRATFAETLDKLASTADEDEAALNRAQQTLATLTAQIKTESEKATTESKARVAAEDRVKTLAAEVEKLRKDAGAPRDPVFSPLGGAEAETRFQTLHLDLQTRDLELAASKATIKGLQAQLDAVTPGAKLMTTKDIFAAFAKDVDDASKDIPNGFEIGDVQVDLRGAIGREGANMVMGLDAHRQVDAESATRVRFTLRRAAVVKTVE